MAGVAVGLDFGAILSIAAAQDADCELLAEILPEIEPVLLAAMNGDAEEE